MHPGTKMIRPKTTPMPPGNVLTSAYVPEMPDKKRQEFDRSIPERPQFAATWVRFDMSYKVGQYTRFCASAGSSHFAALHHLMEYLERHPSFKLDCHNGPTKAKDLDDFYDADWGTSDNRRSITGNIFRYNGAPIAWKSKLPKSVTLSTAEMDSVDSDWWGCLALWRLSTFVSCCWA